MSTCNCRTKINEQLAPYNMKITPIFSLDPQGPLSMPWPISTTQIETGRGKKKAMLLFASFCPFCGASVKKTDASAGGAS